MQVSEYFTKWVTLSPQEKQLIDKTFQTLEINRGEKLLRAGNICQYEVFVKKGCLKSFCLDEKSQEVVFAFAIEQWWAGDFESFNQRTPSDINIEAVEDTELLCITLLQKEWLLTQIPQLERAYRIIVERHLQNYQQRVVSIFTLSAQERYEVFMKKYAKIAIRVPQYSIASYLGISPESLSRIRKKIVSE